AVPPPRAEKDFFDVEESGRKRARSSFIAFTALHSLFASKSPPEAFDLNASCSPLRATAQQLYPAFILKPNNPIESKRDRTPDSPAACRAGIFASFLHRRPLVGHLFRLP